MKPNSWNAAKTQILSEAIDILDTKRNLRGTANITRQGLPGVITRIAEDKLSRIQRSVEDQLFWDLAAARPWAMEALTEHGHTSITTTIEATESLEDDLIDVLNYALIAVALNRGWWELP